jgi:superfamily I DNA and RNA helicase
MAFISEAQKSIVLSKEKYILINGCAGSHKTDTLIKICGENTECNILFITLVASITIEIKDRCEARYSCHFKKSGNKYNSGNIFISTYDAWIHSTLLFNKVPFINTEFGQKRKLCKELNPKCYSSTGKKIDLLIIDEVQDFSQEQMEIIVQLHLRHKKLRIIAAGDFMQSLYYKGGIHSMNLFKSGIPEHICYNL